MNIFQTTIQYIDRDDLKNMKEGKEVEISSSTEQYFSTKEKALSHLKEEIAEMEENDEESWLLRAVIKEIPVDNKEAETELHFYDKKLNYLGKFDWERVTTNPKFNKGEWVLFINSGSLTCGLIDAPADTNGPAYIIYEDSNLKDCSPHAHCDELSILEKISQEQAKNLLPRKYFEGILRRAREYN